MKTPHYYKGKVYGYEAHEVIEDFVSDNYNLGVAVAYLLRAGKKEDNTMVQDLKKAIHHLQFEIKRQNNLNSVVNIEEATEEELERINKNLFNNASFTY